MPNHDRSGRRDSRDRLAFARSRARGDSLFATLMLRFHKRRDDRGEGEPCPVTPNRPLDLSGGAAAALEFDD